MNASNSSLNVKRLILVPALIALAVTMIRLLGELGQGPSFLFSREAGGPGALIGIVWLIPLFGIYFAVKLVRGNQAPQSAGRVIGMAVLSLVVAMAGIALVVLLTGDPNVSVSRSGVILQQLGFTIVCLMAILILRKPWPALFQTMLGYGIVSRLPVVVVMFVTITGNWGTHYELGPPGYPEMGLLLKFFLIGLIPQMTFWVLLTVVWGTLVGGITAVLLQLKTRTPPPDSA